VEDSTVAKCDREPGGGAGDVDHLARKNLAAVAEDFVAAARQQLHRAHALQAKQPVHAVGRRVPRLAVVDDRHPSARPRQCQRGAEAGRSAPDDQHVANGSRVLFHPCPLDEGAGAGSTPPLFENGHPKAIWQTMLPNGKLEGWITQRIAPSTPWGHG
jgi:hypothetical protein